MLALRISEAEYGGLIARPCYATSFYCPNDAIFTRLQCGKHLANKSFDTTFDV